MLEPRFTELPKPKRHAILFVIACGISSGRTMSEAETTIEWAEQIAIICERFDAAMRAGDTFEGFDAWLSQVPDSLRARLAVDLERRRAALSAESIETRVLSSDAVFGPSSFGFDGKEEASEIGSGSAVGRCETFRGLSVASRDALQQRFRRVSHSSGTQILRQGEHAQGLYLILSGLVEIVDTDGGQRIACDGAGSVLGEMSLLMDQSCSADVITTTEVESLFLSTEAYHELKSQHPELEIALQPASQ